jgi:nicotinate phosphoribosyltransferase
MKRGIDKEIATYDLVVREFPQKWNFYVFDGLERLVNGLLNYKFNEESVAILKALNFIDSKKAEDFYRNFKFSGDVWSLKNGTIFFPGEPIVRITAPVAQANMLTAFMLNAIGYSTRLLTKCVRINLATGSSKSSASGSGAVRLASMEHAMYSLRACKILGQPIVCPIFYKKFPEYLNDKRKVIININHAVIKSFESEVAAYQYVLSELTNRTDMISVMIDTYDTEKGLDLFIAEIKKRPKLDLKKLAVTIDSGDIQEQAFYVREVLDENGLSEITIQALSNLDEHKIKKMVDADTPIDFYIAATEVLNITDNPKFEAVYKMAELCRKDGSIEQKAKLTQGKESFPGRKQVFRVYENEKIAYDVVGLEDEKLGKPLLHKFINQGEQVLELPSLEEIGENIKTELSSLPDKYKTIDESHKYFVMLSAELKDMLGEVRKKHVGQINTNEN